MKGITSAKAIKILNEIVSLDGNCLTPERCKNCPLRLECHPTFYKSEDSGRSRFRDFERVNHAMDILTSVVLLEDEEYGKEKNLAQAENES